MRQDEIKTLIWRLDDVLDGLSGLDWIEGAGKIARLKEIYLRRRPDRGIDYHIVAEELAELVGHFDVLSKAIMPRGPRLAALDGAIRRLEAIVRQEPDTMPKENVNRRPA